MIIVLAFAFEILYAQDYWQSVKSPEGDRVDALAADSSGSVFAGTPVGVFRSTNHGQVWIYGSHDSITSQALSLATSTSGRVFAGTASGGVFRSTDRGISWMQVYQDLVIPGQVYDISSNSLGHIVLATAHGIRLSTNSGATWAYLGYPWSGRVCYSVNTEIVGQILAGTGGGGVSRSTDGGHSWVLLNNGLDNLYVNELKVLPSGRVLAATSGGVYRSNDSGATWIFSSTGLTNHQVLSLIYTNSGNVLIGTGGGVFVSSDEGNSWTPTSTGLSNTNISAMLVSAGETILLGTPDGVFRSSNSGANWAEANSGLTARSIDALAVLNQDTMVVHCSNKAAYRSTNRGVTWIRVDSLSFNSSPSFSWSPDGNMFASSLRHVYRSSDHGETWVHADSGIALDANISDVAIHSSGTLLCGAFRGLFRSTNKGIGWARVDSGLPMIKCIGSGRHTNLFAGGFGTILHSTNDGLTWSQTNFSREESVLDIAITANGDAFAGSHFGLYRSTDNGLTWESIGQNTFARGVSHILVNARDQVFAANDGGVFRSTDAGSTWSSIITGLKSGVRSFCEDSNGYLFAGTYGGGIFRSVNSTMTVTGDKSITPTSVALDQNYPNPFNPTTRIYFRIPNTQHVQLRIFDVLGREVASLLSGLLEAGMYHVEWNASDRASGVYYLQLRTGSIVLAKKMVLMR